jgi:hypothetical protein
VDAELVRIFTESRGWEGITAPVSIGGRPI